jgi:hypothetical protein
MKSIVFTLSILISTASFAAAENCVVSPDATLVVPGKVLPMDWSNKSDLTRAFQDIGYTPGPLKTEFSEGDKSTNLTLICDALREGREIVFTCAAALVISQKQNGQWSTLSKVSTQAYDGASLQEAMFNATVAATRRTPRCQ